MRILFRSRNGLCTRLVSFCLILLLSPSTGWGQEDPLTPYRERFQEGLARYRAGDVLTAVQYWEPIRRELGDEKAFRLLYNLGRAYEVMGDATQAAERYQSFLSLARAKAQEKPLDPIVQENVVEANQRLNDLRKTRGRIRVVASDRPGLVQVDLGEARLGAFEAYVAPGPHTVTIDRGTKIERSIQLTLRAGQEAVVDPSRPRPSSVVAKPPPPVPALPPSKPAPLKKERTHPFPSYVLVISGGVSAVSFLAPWLAYRNADNLSDEYNDPATSVSRRRDLQGDYDTARTTYRWMWVVPAATVVTTGVLTLWYVGGTEERVVVDGGVGPSAGWAGLRGTF